MKCKDRCEYKYFDNTCCKECEDENCPNRCPFADEEGKCDDEQE